MNMAEVNQAFAEKVERGIFNPVRRHIKIEHEAEDRWADALAQTWRMYSRYALDKDTVLSDAILVHSCRQRAVDLPIAEGFMYRFHPLWDEVREVLAGRGAALPWLTPRSMVPNPGNVVGRVSGRFQ